MLAQLPPVTQSQLGLAVTLGAMALMLLCNVAVALAAWRKRDISPQPLEVRAVADSVPDAACKERMRVLERELARIVAAKNEADASAKKDRKDLYDHIDNVRHELTDKIDTMPSQIVALLKNTGAIKK